MDNRTDFNILRLTKELDSAVICGDIEKADEITDKLFHLQGGLEADAIMPEQFPVNIAVNKRIESGGHKMKPRSIKKIVCIAAAAALIMALSITALATHLFGIKDLVIKSDGKGTVTESGVAASNTDGKTEAEAGTAIPGSDKKIEEQERDLIALQGYPDSNEYKAVQEWNAFCAGYDTDHSILNKIGNSLTEYNEKYPMYLVYTQEMADKLEEIIAKYGLALHKSMTIVESSEELISKADTGNFLENANNTVMGGYVYNDGTFHYDGEAILKNGSKIEYQFGNYVKGTFSDTYLNVGNADSYKEWLYTTSSGVKVSLALSESKALVIADLGDSFLTINVLTGTGRNELLEAKKSITDENLQEFADLFDYSVIN